MNIVLLVIGVVAAILGIIIRVLTKDTDYEKDGKHYAHPMIIGGLILLVFSQLSQILTLKKAIIRPLQINRLRSLRMKSSRLKINGRLKRRKQMLRLKRRRQKLKLTQL